MRIFDFEQGSAEWFAARNGIPTATDFADIVTAVKGDLSAGADSCINRLLDEIVRPDAQAITVFAGNRHTERGKELEPAARRAYEFLTGNPVRVVGFVARDDGKAGCSPDGITDFGGLEIKCPDGPTHVGYLRAGILPAKYRQQVHGGMVITGFRRWDFFSYCPGYAPFFVSVAWDEYTDKVSAALDQFVARLDAAKKELGIAA
jgi:hypothetical protein